MSFKLAIIGAGSLVFARTLFTDIMSVPEFRNIEIAFTDINQDNLDKVTHLCQRDLEANGIKTKIQSTLDRREAFKDAKYIINCVRIGVLEGFETDVEIPLKYGVDQCVGDTLCTGGIMYGQRTIWELLNFCKDIREVAAPNAILLNYSNPNAMVTWACNKYGGVPTIGLCHGEIHGEHQIAEVLKIPHEELDFICAGINHQTWYISVKHHGAEMLERIRNEFDSVERFQKEEKVRIDILKRFGYYSTESNGHLSEYVSWYRKRPQDIEKWIDTSSWIHGETGGYLRVTREERDWFLTDYPKIAAEPPKKYDGSCRGKEHGSYIMEALETGRTYRGHFNVMNNGCITNLPDESVVEVPCYVDGNGISVPKVGDLPLGCAAVCSQSIWVQKLAVEAAVAGDVQLLKQAALMDPLTGAVCDPPEIWQMIDEMLIAQEEWLPQYKEAIAQAKENFAKGNLIPTKEDYRGAVRIRQKTVEEVAQEHEKRNITAQ
ncbi:alpha-glucosidase/alpha-galactosidase [Scatolibacter rhodanostii]|uniref:alpha-glucosidase/alpha-galactosidase n=1 Tax=Scatolibacter rhodanostii TaxID=2014781 RepID=UPI000C06A6FC|nr:alpha-glucosidase/alpha-galactosidase [Scatolibacter rhodanostii]